MNTVNINKLDVENELCDDTSICVIDYGVNKGNLALREIKEILSVPRGDRVAQTIYLDVDGNYLQFELNDYWYEYYNGRLANILVKQLGKESIIVPDPNLGGRFVNITNKLESTIQLTLQGTSPSTVQFFGNGYDDNAITTLDISNVTTLETIIFYPYSLKCKHLDLRNNFANLSWVDCSDNTNSVQYLLMSSTSNKTVIINKTNPFYYANAYFYSIGDILQYVGDFTGLYPVNVYIYGRTTALSESELSEFSSKNITPVLINGL